ncbi:MAG: 2,3-diaminopropionate biosynthesis protein SbnA [Rubrivivax sp.]|nr:2,3-diaminopropionate biosynthesis protein SbnA [Rubrivivax sp.]
MSSSRRLAGSPTTGILSTVGHTPLVRLERLFASSGMAFFAKLEAHNPGGSMKDRPALRMVREAMVRGEIGHHSVLVESSSGNLAIGLAQVCAALELRLIVVVDPKVTQTNLKILQAYGASVDMVSTPDPQTGEYLAARRKRVAHLVATLPGAVNLNQYANPGNPAAHREGTVSEILDALDNRLDWLVVSISTCGTLRGARLAIRDRGLDTRILAVDAAGSVIFGQRGARLLPGHGAGIVPEHMADDLADEHALVTDAQCVAGCRALVAREAVLAGASSGGIVAALHAWQSRWPAGTRVAAVMPDRGERYLDTVYDDAWCERHFGAVPVLNPISKSLKKQSRELAT